MVGVFAKSPRGRSNALRSKYFSDDRVGMTRISPAAAMQSEAVFDSFQPAEVLREPFELDQPIQCPLPESSILEVVPLGSPRGGGLSINFLPFRPTEWKISKSFKKLSLNIAESRKEENQGFLETFQPHLEKNMDRCGLQRSSQEGILWRPRILENLRRRNDIWSASIQQESILRGGMIPNRRSLEHFLFAGHGAPEYEFRKIA